MDIRLPIRHVFAILFVLTFGWISAGAAGAAANTTTTVTSSSPGNTSVYGTAVTLTVIVQGLPGAAPSGPVTFTDSVDGTLGVPNLPAPTTGQVVAGNNSVTLTTSALTAGPHTITATYGGDGNYNGSSNTVSQTVTQAGTALSTPTTSLSPSNPGDVVTFSTTLSLTSGGGTPHGAIVFQDAGTAFTSVPVNGTGTYSASYGGLASGTHSITAFYSSDANYTTATSPPLSQVVKNGTTTTLASSQPSSTYGQSITLTATVSGGSSPTGTVQFQDTFNSATTTLGSIILSGGQAQFTVSNLGAGTHNIVAIFSGDGFNGGSSASLTQQVAQATPTLSLATTPSPAQLVTGQQITLSATLSPQFAGSGPPAGSVSFTATPQGGSPRSLGTGTLSGGATSITASSLIASESQYTVTATYVPGSDPNFAAVSQSTAVTVSKANTSISAPVSSSSTASFGQPVTITAQVSVTSPGGGQPGGTVTFTDNYTSGSGATAVLTYGPFSIGGNGQAQFTTTATQLAPGAHAITAVYSGDGNYNGAGPSAALTQTVVTAGVSVAVASNLSTPVYGQPITFTASIGSGAGSPGGSVQFQVDGAATGAPVPVTSGQAALTIPSGPIPAIGAGAHTITAVYSGDPNFAAGSGSTPQNIGKAATTASVTSNPSSASTFGQAVTFTAQVAVTSPGAGTPTQTVTFQDTFNGSTTTIGTGNVNAGGQAQFTTTTLGVGAHSITVIYGGDANFSASAASASLPLTVNQAANTILVSSTNNADAGAAPNTSLYGQSLTFTASVRGGTAGTPTGVVDFFDASTTPPTQIGSGTLDSAGTTKATTSVLTAGNHPITAHYEGDAANAAADSSPPVIQVIGKAATATAVTTNNTTPNPGQPVTLTATVTDTTPGSAITPKTPGTVQFQLDGTNVMHDGTPGDQAIPLSDSGQASFIAGSLAAGAHQIKAVYSGDNNFTGSTGSFTQPSAVPTITRLTPNSELEHDPTFPISIDGSGFVQGAVVNFNGNPIKADSVASSGTTITVTINGKFLAQPGTVPVTVSNPGQSVASNTLPFQIKSPNGPALFSSNPTAVLAGLVSPNDALTITLKGSNFSPNAQVGYTPASTGSTIIFNKQNANVTFVDPTTLTFALPGSFLQAADTATITVRNQDAGGGGDIVSSPITFTIGENPTPFISSLDPAGISVNGNPGTNSFTLNLLGANFLRGAIVTFTDPQNGSTVFGTDNATVNTTGDQVSVTVPNKLVPQAGRYVVQVTNIKSLNATDPYAGAQASNSQPFQVSNRQPFVDAGKFSPAFAVAGATTAPNAFALTITGSNFDPGATPTSQHSTVIFNNTALSQNSVRVINSTTLVANIDASLVSTAGLATLVVSNIGSDGVTQILSNPVQFPINPVYARGTYPSHGVVMFSVPYDYSGTNPFDVIKEVTFGPGLSPGGQYFGLGTTPGSNVLSDLHDLLSLSVNATAKIAQWSPQAVAYSFASAPPTLDLQLQLGRAYWGVNFPDKSGGLPGAFGIIKIGASATVNPYPVPLTKGWNMIGDPYPTPVSIFGITVQRAGRVYSFSDAVANGFISPIFWSYEGGASYASHFAGKIDPSSPVKDTLDPFAGYWLLCNTDCQLLVPRP